ncbi:PadR family transcriptional regulator [Salinactinospora qingdaonensis]|uniref:PadR family transcriptional regulator n=1 Tax=Salinactinospora qingdaonensis TaxID=702744 RepID=A0ABP7G918_9ACTN
MSTIFGHGRLRLYLLKLLDENPRHGYEIISLLRDRFLGVYSPSPGTIYPRLSRLEEEGLVTHEKVNDRKVYRLTDKGREELHRHSDDLDELERELTASVSDIARAVKEDVRDTISSLRAELKFGPRGGEQRDTGEEGAANDERATSDKRDTGAWWERDWEKFARGFSTWGPPWSKHGRHEDESSGPEFDRTLSDFSERVSRVMREAGQVGESAANDLRRILDDTIEVIRRDLAGWGPGGEESRTDTTGDSSGSPDHGDAARSEQAGERSPREEPPHAEGGSSDPWQTVTHDEGDQPATGSADDDPGTTDPGGDTTTR